MPIFFPLSWALVSFLLSSKHFISPLTFSEPSSYLRPCLVQRHHHASITHDGLCTAKGFLTPLFSLSLSFFFFLAAGILCPRAGIKPVSLQQKHGVSHWTTRVKTSLLLYPKTKCHPIPSQYAGNCPSPSLQVKSPCLACILLIIFLD